MNLNFFSEYYAESWDFREWFKLNDIHCANVKIGESVIDSMNKRHVGPAVYFLKPRTLLDLAVEVRNADAHGFLNDKIFVCGSGWHDSTKPYQNDLLYFFEHHFTEWQDACKIFKDNGKIIIFLTDGKPSTRLKDLGVFDFVEFYFEFLFYANTYLFEKLDRKPDMDFMYVTMEKKYRAHRDITYDLLKQKGLHHGSICQKNIRNNREKFKDLVTSYGKGLYDLELNWYDRFPSINYYNRTNFEIVAETFGELGNDAFFPTEKIIKPIIMKHPFLVSGSRNYLENLRSMGFRTFGDIIDESYDHIVDMQERMGALVEAVDAIIRDGSSLFYERSREICEHNFQHLCDMQGRRKNVLWKNMKKVMEKINENQSH